MDQGARGPPARLAYLGLWMHCLWLVANTPGRFEEGQTARRFNAHPPRSDRRYGHHSYRGDLRDRLKVVGTSRESVGCKPTCSRNVPMGLTPGTRHHGQLLGQHCVGGQDQLTDEVQVPAEIVTGDRMFGGRAGGGPARPMSNTSPFSGQSVQLGARLGWLHLVPTPAFRNVPPKVLEEHGSHPVGAWRVERLQVMGEAVPKKPRQKRLPGPGQGIDSLLKAVLEVGLQGR